MADIELIIKIDANIANGIIYGHGDEPRNIVRSFQATIADAIKNGTLLPKGHGRLIDADELLRKHPDFDAYPFPSTTIDNAPTIIEADKESEEI